MNKDKCDLLSRKGVCSAVLRAMRNQQKSISELRGPCTFGAMEIYSNPRIERDVMLNNVET